MPDFHTLKSGRVVRKENGETPPKGARKATDREIALAGYTAAQQADPVSAAVKPEPASKSEPNADSGKSKTKGAKS